MSGTVLVAFFVALTFLRRRLGALTRRKSSEASMRMTPGTPSAPDWRVARRR